MKLDRVLSICIFQSHNLLLPYPVTFMDPYQKAAEAGSVSYPAQRWSLIPSCFEGVEFSTVCIVVGGWQLICIFQKLDMLFALCFYSGSLLGHSVFLLPLLLCHCVALARWCFTDSWVHHLFRVLPFDLAAAWRSQSSVSLPTCVCMQVMNERYSLQQTGPLVLSSHSGALWCSSDPSEIPAKASVVNRIDMVSGFPWEMCLKVMKLIVQMETCHLEVRYFLVA